MFALVIEWRVAPLLYLLVGFLFARSYARFTADKQRESDGEVAGFMVACGAMWLLWPIAVFMFVIAGLGAVAIKSVGKVSE
jgi:hypothetical protein